MRSLWGILALSTFAVAGCQLVGGFEDFSSEGGAAGSAGGSAGAGTTGGGAGGAPTGECPVAPPGSEEEWEKIKGSDGRCVLILKRTVAVDEFYLSANDVPGPASAGDGPCAKLFGETFACLTTGGGVCRQAPVSCVTNEEAADFCSELGDDVRLCSLEELRRECEKARKVREWAVRCVPNDGSGEDCDTLGDLPEFNPDLPNYSCDQTAQTRSDDRRPDLGFRCCVGPEPVLPP